jgi:uncharacterized protein (TIGR02452 family)
MHSNTRDWRASVFADTQRRATHYPCDPSVRVFHNPSLVLRRTQPTTEITVINADSIDAAKDLQSAGFNPLILTFASDIHAGGGVATGAGAQEESLWRRTNLCATQFQTLYPLAADPPEGVYSPKVTVFKKKESEGCGLLATPFSASFLAVPAIRNPRLLPNSRFGPRYRATFLRKIELIFQIAHTNGHDSLVLGPFGCGAWNCPPQEVAELFKLMLDTYRGVFRKVVFACYCVEGGSHGYRDQSVTNYEIFKSVLG